MEKSSWNYGTKNVEFSASWFTRLYSYMMPISFGLTLWIACHLHYYSIVKNRWASYPEEWLPSISATVGDWFPEKNLFHILIAALSGPCFFHYFCQLLSLSHRLPFWKCFLVLLLCAAKLLAAGLFIFVTSCDSHLIHDNAAVGYLIITLIYMTVMTTISRYPEQAAKRKRVLTIFICNLAPLIYFGVDHLLYHTPGEACFEYASVVELDQVRISIEVAALKQL